jgi:hypothetical protein
LRSGRRSEGIAEAAAQYHSSSPPDARAGAQTVRWTAVREIIKPWLTLIEHDHAQRNVQSVGIMRANKSMITLSGTFKAWESCEQTRRSSIFGLHSQAENALI